MYRSAAVLLVVSLVAGATPALAQAGRTPGSTTGQGGQGTPEERAACRPDVRRHCRNAGEDSMRVLSCLQEHRARLSRACRSVLERNGQ
jgi:cysteine rich repeat protein